MEFPIHPPSPPLALPNRLPYLAAPPDCLALLAGDYLIGRIHGLNLDHIHLKVPALPPSPPLVMSTQAKEGKDEIMAKREISMEETRKLLRASRMEVMRARLRAIQKKLHSLLKVYKDLAKQTHATSHNLSLSLSLHRQALCPHHLDLPLLSFLSLLRHRLQHYSIVRPTLSPSDRLALLADNRLVKRINGLNPDRIRLEGPAPSLQPSPLVTLTQVKEEKEEIRINRRI